MICFFLSVLPGCWVNMELNPVPSFLFKCWEADTIFLGYKVRFLLNFMEWSRGDLATMVAKKANEEEAVVFAML